MYKGFKDSGDLFLEYKTCFKPDGTFDPTDPVCVQACKSRPSQPACKAYLDSIKPPPYVCINPIGVTMPYYASYTPGVIYKDCEFDDPLRNIYTDRYDAIVTAVNQNTVETFTASPSATPSSVTLTVQVPTINKVSKIVIKNPDRVFKIGDKVKTYGKGSMVAGVFIPGPAPKPPAPKPDVVKGFVQRVIDADNVAVQYKLASGVPTADRFTKKAHGLKALQPLNVSIVNRKIVSIVASGPVPKPVTVQGMVIDYNSPTTISVSYMLNGKRITSAGPGDLRKFKRKQTVLITLVGSTVTSIAPVPKPVMVSGVVVSRVLPKTITVQYTLAGKVTRSVFTTTAVKFQVRQPVTITLLGGKVTNVVAAPKPVVVSGVVVSRVLPKTITVQYTLAGKVTRSVFTTTAAKFQVRQPVTITLLGDKVTNVVAAPKPVVVSGVVISRVLPKTITVQYTLAGKVTKSAFTTTAVKFKVRQPVKVSLLNGKVVSVV